MSLDQAKKYTGQRRVSLLFTVGQKNAWVVHEALNKQSI